MSGFVLDLAPRARKPRRDAGLVPGHTLAIGLVARWLFNAGAGNTVHSLNRQYTGTITNPTNSTSGWRTGQDGPAWFIGPFVSGETSYLKVPGIPFPAICSYEAIWVHSPAPDSAGILETTDGGYNNGTVDRTLFTDGTSHLTAYIYDGAAKTAVGPVLTASTRYHAVFTVDGSNLTLYLDGVQVAQTAAGNAYTGYTTPSFFFGAGTNAGSGPLGFGGGTLITCGMWSRALTAREVLTLYRTPWDMAVVPGRILSRISPPPGAAVAATTVERRTLSPLGARVGSRQAS